ncbi:MAG: response regulator transcription factor [Bacteroidales bacterium]|jgi:DNA-binding NarL/FixJ family response regulator|nr:response regulator transcription factor [Bacteroidales bacterium]MCI2121544.1 response regulator transcription factor [Bacteroidales bacterium]MCI2145425.1 response regulator transcription factor [Bacteroidales bacterium]
MFEETYLESAKKISAIVVDDHPLMLEGISSVISRKSDRIEVVGTASSYDALFKLLEKESPDIVLLDIIMPGMSGIEVAKRLRREYPDVKILMLSSNCSEITLMEAMNVGINGFISKSVPASELITAVEYIADGESYFGRDIARIIESITSERTQRKDMFTKRELEIIDLCCAGMTSREIARQLNISMRTVETHKNNIFRHLNISNSVELVKAAIAKHLIQI